MPRLTLESLFVLRFSGRHLAMKSGQGTERLIGRQRGKSARKACQAGSLLIDTLSWKDSSTRYSTSLEYSTDYKRYQKPMLVLWMDLEEVKVEMKFRSTRMIAPNRKSGFSAENLSLAAFDEPAIFISPCSTSPS